MEGVLLMHSRCHRSSVTQEACWTTFTYFSPQIRKITNLFKNTNVKIVFKNTNTLQQLIKPRPDNTTPEHEKSSIYKLTCNTCHVEHRTDEMQLETTIPGAHQIYKKQ
jgi:hypothetical protein